MKAFLMLGKCGDLISALPIVHHEFSKAQEKPVMIVSREYANLLERVPYVTPCIYEGPWHDLSGALKWAKKQFSNVVVLSTYGEGFPVEHRRSSFQLDVYDRAGVLPLWDKLPLEVYRNRDYEREVLERLALHGHRFILFADHSQSSPFLQKEELGSLLAEFALQNRPVRAVVRLSGLRLPNFFDCLPFYDAADAIVTIETSHLHLSAATKTPVLALATDKPSRWNGSAHSKRFAFFCRYSEFSSRKSELVDTLRDALDGVAKPEVLCLN